MVAGHIAEKSLAVAVRNGINDLPGNVAKGVVQPGRKLGDRLRGQRGAFGESPPPLKQIHSKETLTTGSSRYSYDHWSKQSTGDIVRSLRPGLEESLKIKPDGRVMNGNTRTTILQERGFDINSLPMEVYK